ncbi:hypothetical protein C8R43DRAFT_949432 [Mycena crocata]|nr:hypothetical protein C8R43DRAFT_949432 [Mycena crocata]
MSHGPWPRVPYLRVILHERGKEMGALDDLAKQKVIETVKTTEKELGRYGAVGVLRDGGFSELVEVCCQNHRKKLFHCTLLPGPETLFEVLLEEHNACVMPLKREVGGRWLGRCFLDRTTGHCGWCQWMVARSQSFSFKAEEGGARKRRKASGGSVEHGRTQHGYLSIERVLHNFRGGWTAGPAEIIARKTGIYLRSDQYQHHFPRWKKCSCPGFDSLSPVVSISASPGGEADLADAMEETGTGRASGAVLSLGPLSHTRLFGTVFRIVPHQFAPPVPEGIVSQAKTPGFVTHRAMRSRAERAFGCVELHVTAFGLSLAKHGDKADKKIEANTASTFMQNQKKTEKKTEVEESVVPGLYFKICRRSAASALGAVAHGARPVASSQDVASSREITNIPFGKAQGSNLSAEFALERSKFEIGSIYYETLVDHGSRVNTYGLAKREALVGALVTEPAAEYVAEMVNFGDMQVFHLRVGRPLLTLTAAMLIISASRYGIIFVPALQLIKKVRVRVRGGLNVSALREVAREFGTRVAREWSVGRARHGDVVRRWPLFCTVDVWGIVRLRRNVSLAPGLVGRQTDREDCAQLRQHACVADGGSLASRRRNAGSWEEVEEEAAQTSRREASSERLQATHTNAHLKSFFVESELEEAGLCPHIRLDFDLADEGARGSFEKLHRVQSTFDDENVEFLMRKIVPAPTWDNLSCCQNAINTRMYQKAVGLKRQRRGEAGIHPKVLELDRVEVGGRVEPPCVLDQLTVGAQLRELPRGEGPARTPSGFEGSIARPAKDDILSDVVAAGESRNKSGINLQARPIFFERKKVGEHKGGSGTVTSVATQEVEVICKRVRGEVIQDRETEDEISRRCSGVPDHPTHVPYRSAGRASTVEQWRREGRDENEILCFSSDVTNGLLYMPLSVGLGPLLRKFGSWKYRKPYRDRYRRHSRHRSVGV